jgi:hypothetical protein
MKTPRRKRLKMWKNKGQFLANLIVELSTRVPFNLAKDK